MSEELKIEPIMTEAEIDLYGDTENLDQFTENEVLGTTGDDEPTGNGARDDNIVDEAEVDGDLFDAVLTEGSAQSQGANISVENHVNNTSGHSIGGGIISSGLPTRRFCCYVGNMTWWTTDQDLADAIANVGIGDLLEIKFYENRANGQSKGFALASFASDSSVREAMEKLPSQKLHGQQLVAMPYTKQSLGQFEAATRRPGERNEKQQAKSGPVGPVENKPPNFMGTIRVGAGGPPPPGAGPVGPPVMMRPAGPPMGMGPPPPGMGGHYVGMGAPPRMMQPGPPGGMQIRVPVSGPPPVAPPPATNRPPPGFPTAPPRTGMPLGMPTNNPPPGIPPPGAHINPNVYPGVAAAAAGVPPPSAALPGHQEPPLSEPEFEEIMNRNRTVSSSAISRAVSDAAAGDFASAIETLVTAISLIRQSRVAHDDRCKVLITSLQDTLHGIEAKSYARRGGKDRSRDRSRSPREGRSKRHRRSRSRSRSRDRYEYSPRHRRY